MIDEIVNHPSRYKFILGREEARFGNEIAMGCTPMKIVVDKTKAYVAEIYWFDPGKLMARHLIRIYKVDGVYRYYWINTFITSRPIIRNGDYYYKTLTGYMNNITDANTKNAINTIVDILTDNYNDNGVIL